MIKLLWNLIDRKNYPIETKIKMVLLISGILYGLFGFLIWLPVHLIALDSLDWLLCFIGYPIILSCFTVVFYSCRHEFHDID